jgi:hypothetical protein
MSCAALLCAVTLVLDALLLALMMPGLALSPVQLWALLAAHAGLCLLFSLALPGLLPQRLRQRSLGLFVFLGTVFMPVLGMLGLLACIVPVLRQQGALADPSGGWQHARSPHLPGKPAQRPGSSTALSKGSDLAGPLQHATDPGKRICALIATLSLDGQQAVPLLRLALKDPDDEVRLLAYALLNRKEKAVEARMREQHVWSAGDMPERLFLRHKALAHDYWELAHLGDPHGDALVSLCGRAHEHVQAALKLRPHDGGLQFLAGQILLVQMQFDAASEAFRAAQRCGIDARQSAAMLAEIAFRRQRYADVPRHLAQAGSGGRQFALDRLSSYWAGGTP